MLIGRLIFSSQILGGAHANPRQIQIRAAQLRKQRIQLLVSASIIAAIDHFERAREPRGRRKGWERAKAVSASDASAVSG